MELTVFKERENSTEKIIFSGITVKELLQQLKVNPETIIIVRNSEVIMGDEILNSNDHIKLLSVISGG